MNTSKPELVSRLNQETGKLGWVDIERHFSRGVVVKVEAGLDLIEVAAVMVEDNKTTFVRWMEAGQVARATQDDALRWQSVEAQFWAIVIAPWLLVQEIGLQQ
jgi:hypothetical protein